MARRGRRQMQKRIIGYDLFRLTDLELSRRLMLAYMPHNDFTDINYSENENYFHIDIYDKLIRLDYLQDYEQYITELQNEINRKNLINDKLGEPLLQLSLRDKCICALRAYYTNT